MIPRYTPTSTSTHNVLIWQMYSGTLRYDLPIKYMCARDLLAKRRRVGWDYYQKLYAAIGKQHERRIRQFTELVSQQLDTQRYPLMLTHDLRLWNGSHRLALATCLREQSVHVIRTKKRFRRWRLPSIADLFTGDEIGAIHKAEAEMITRYYQ
jgi:hypothetical protein